jgi:hypothetical protein
VTNQNSKGVCISKANGMAVTKWMDKRDVLFTLTELEDVMFETSKRYQTNEDAKRNIGETRNKPSVIRA